jgi:hypothetical protein
MTSAAAIKRDPSAATPTETFHENRFRASFNGRIKKPAIREEQKTSLDVNHALNFESGMIAAGDEDHVEQ